MLPDDLEDALRGLSPWEADPAIRVALLQRFTALGQQRRRDADGRLRWLLLRALRGLATTADVPLLLEATRTFEYMPPPPPGEVAHGIRAEALGRLFEVEPDLARWRAVEMLSDPDHNVVSGEPAVTAVRLLGSGDDQRLLYSVAYANPYNLPSAARGETLIWLDDLPQDRLQAVLKRFVELNDATLLLAVIDVAIDRKIGWLDALLVDALVRTTEVEAFRYAVLQAAARHREVLIEAVAERLDSTLDRRKVEIVEESWTEP